VPGKEKPGQDRHPGRALVRPSSHSDASAVVNYCLLGSFSRSSRGLGGRSSGISSRGSFGSRSSLRSRGSLGSRSSLNSGSFFLLRAGGQSQRNDERAQSKFCFHRTITPEMNGKCRDQKTTKGRDALTTYIAAQNSSAFASRFNVNGRMNLLVAVSRQSRNQGATDGNMSA